MFYQKTPYQREIKPVGMYREKLKRYEYSRRCATRKVSKYGFFSGPYFPAFGLNMDI